MENRRGEVDAVTDLILGAPKSLWMVIAAMKLRHLILEEQLWQPLPVFLPGEVHGQRSPAGHRSWGHKESDTTVWLTHTHTHTHTHTQLEGFWDLVTIKPIGDVMEKKRHLWLLSPCTQKTWKASQKCVKDMLWHLPWSLTAVLSCLPTTFNSGFGIPFLYRTIQIY